MKTDCELGHKAIFKLEHYPEALFEVPNALLNKSWVKKKKEKDEHFNLNNKMLHTKTCEYLESKLTIDPTKSHTGPQSLTTDSYH